MNHVRIDRPVYYKVFAALLVLLALTVGAAYLPLGPFGLAVALLIAFAKAGLVVLYFMHVRYASRTTWVFAGAAFFWLLILFGLTFTDYAARTPETADMDYFERRPPTDAASPAEDL